MGSLKEVRNRITSVNSTKQITNAMKMVSASKLRKNQDAVLKLRPYIKKFAEIIDAIASSSDQIKDVSPFLEVRDVEKVLIVVVSSNRGMCGSFNSNVIKEAVKIIEEEYNTFKENGSLSIITIGKKASDYFSKHQYNVVEKLDSIFDNLNYENTVKIIDSITNKFMNKDIDRCVIVSNRFRNAAIYDLTKDQLLPIQITDLKKEEESNILLDYIYEPSKEEILENLIAQYIKIQFYRILLSSFAAEHGSRMTAMSKATDNATELLKELRLSYNKARQATITNEILEIVGGAEALKK